MSEHLSNTERLDQRRLSAAVKDFLYSFRFSQGDGTLQQKLFKGLMAHYDRDTLQFLHANMQQLMNRFSSLDVPGTHAQLDQDDPYKIMDEFTKQANAYLTELVITSGNPNSSNKMIPDDKIFIVTRTIQRDTTYQNKQRSYSPDDPHLSCFREYMLNAVATGSAVYDSIFYDVTDSLLRGNISLSEFQSDELSRLANLWERNHPGEIFIPESAWNRR